MASVLKQPFNFKTTVSKISSRKPSKRRFRGFGTTANFSFMLTFSQLGSRFSAEASFELQTDISGAWLWKAFKTTFTKIWQRALNRHFRGMNDGFRASGGDPNAPRSACSLGGCANPRKGRVKERKSSERSL